jgi:cyclopropane fatty-acyl-phospholipid synthase-like methyltransferase
LAEKFGCKVDGFDLNREFVEYSNRKAAEEGLVSLVSFRRCDINDLKVVDQAYDVGVCLGALYIFRDAGLRALAEGVKAQGCLAISDIFCKKVPAPKAVTDVFFEEKGEPLTLEDLRRVYAQRGFHILREVECSRKAWLEYYNLTREMLDALAIENSSNDAMQAEIAKEIEEDNLIRQYGDEFVGYMTFIMKRP